MTFRRGALKFAAASLQFALFAVLCRITASPPTLKRVEASLRKENGQQGKIIRMREISDKANAIMSSIPIKNLPFEPSRWKEGDPDPEPSPEEERELMQIVSGAEVIPMKAKKPPLIVLEPARLDSVSIFLSAGEPDLPAFLDRRKPKTPEAPEASPR